MRCPDTAVFFRPSPPLVAARSLTRLPICSGKSHQGLWTQAQPAGNQLKSHRPRAVRPSDRYRRVRAIRNSPSDVAACHRVVRRHTCCSPATRRSMRTTQARAAPGVNLDQPASPGCRPSLWRGPNKEFYFKKFKTKKLRRLEDQKSHFAQFGLSSNCVIKRNPRTP